MPVTASLKMKREQAMYVPETFALTDPEQIRNVIRDYDFGLLVTANGGGPTATHLPFLLDETSGAQGTLFGHMARPNRHWRDLEAMDPDDEVLVIFQGPHSYISPSWYGPEAKAVPTWNYVAVHVYGRPRVIRARDQIMHLLEKMVNAQEARLEDPWSLDRLETGFVETMTRGIVCFEIAITRIEAKAKLSQNKAAEMQRHAAEVLSKGDAPAREVARLMARNLAG